MQKDVFIDSSAKRHFELQVPIKANFPVPMELGLLRALRSACHHQEYLKVGALRMQGRPGRSGQGGLHPCLYLPLILSLSSTKLNDNPYISLLLFLP